MNVAIRATGLGKRYRTGWALRDCYLQIPAGRICALVGPNGAGKTTLLRLALGLLKPSAGDISVFGWSPTTNATLVLARVGFVPQDRPLYRRFTVAEMLHLGRSLNPRWDQVAAAGRLRRLEIPLDRQLGQLSGGQQAQVSLALALGKRPDLLLLDEPVSNLDPLARRQFLSELVQVVAADGLTVVLSSHVVAELERVCDHLVILNAGRVQVMGEIEALLDMHKLLIAPSLNPADVAGDQSVVQATHTERQSALLVKVGSQPVRSDWEAHSVSLEDMVLAYLGNPSVSTLPTPALEEVPR